MAYAITASIRDTTLIVGVPDAPAALDKIGELMLGGFHIDAVTNEDWAELSPADLAGAASLAGLLAP